jgi:hypothetical protein
VILH